jgi:hypothetical protein
MGPPDPLDTFVRDSRDQHNVTASIFAFNAVVVTLIIAGFLGS